MGEIVNRAWGYYEVLDDFPGKWKIKRLVVKPHHATSFQRHNQREELWLILEGKGTIIREQCYDLISECVNVGDIVQIDKGKWHQIINGTPEHLVIHELQVGICDEEDIERQ